MSADLPPIPPPVPPKDNPKAIVPDEEWTTPLNARIQLGPASLVNKPRENLRKGGGHLVTWTHLDGQYKEAMANVKSMACNCEQCEPAKSDSKDLEPDQKWRKALEARIQIRVASLFNEAKQNQLIKLRKGVVSPETRRRLDEQYKDATANIKLMATKQYEAELEKERNRRRWIAGEPTRCGWEKLFLAVQPLILNGIKQTQTPTIIDAATISTRSTLTLSLPLTRPCTEKATPAGAPKREEEWELVEAEPQRRVAERRVAIPSHQPRLIRRPGTFHLRKQEQGERDNKEEARHQDKEAARQAKDAHILAEELKQEEAEAVRSAEQAHKIEEKAKRKAEEMKKWQEEATQKEVKKQSEINKREQDAQKLNVDAKRHESEEQQKETELKKNCEIREREEALSLRELEVKRREQMARQREEDVKRLAEEQEKVAEVKQMEFEAVKEGRQLGQLWQEGEVKKKIDDLAKKESDLNARENAVAEWEQIAEIIVEIARRLEEVTKQIQNEAKQMEQDIRTKVTQANNLEQRAKEYATRLEDEAKQRITALEKDAERKVIAATKSEEAARQNAKNRKERARKDEKRLKENFAKGIQMRQEAQMLVEEYTKKFDELLQFKKDILAREKECQRREEDARFSGNLTVDRVSRQYAITGITTTSSRTPSILSSSISLADREQYFQEHQQHPTSALLENPPSYESSLLSVTDMEAFYKMQQSFPVQDLPQS